MLLVGPSKPDRLEGRDPTRFDAKLHISMLRIRLTTSSCKKAGNENGDKIFYTLLRHAWVLWTR